jgi:hypothetical protein
VAYNKLFKECAKLNVMKTLGADLYRSWGPVFNNPKIFKNSYKKYYFLYCGPVELMFNFHLSYDRSDFVSNLFNFKKKFHL